MIACMAVMMDWCAWATAQQLAGKQDWPSGRSCRDYAIGQ